MRVARAAGAVCTFSTHALTRIADLYGDAKPTPRPLI